MERSLVKNLYKTLELLDLGYALKKEYFKSRFPKKTEREIERELLKALVERKEAQWKSVKVSSKL